MSARRRTLRARTSQPAQITCLCARGSRRQDADRRSACTAKCRCRRSVRPSRAFCPPQGFVHRRGPGGPERVGGDGSDEVENLIGSVCPDNHEQHGRRSRDPDGRHHRCRPASRVEGLPEFGAVAGYHDFDNHTTRVEQIVDHEPDDGAHRHARGVGHVRANEPRSATRFESTKAKITALVAATAAAAIPLSARGQRNAKPPEPHADKRQQRHRGRGPAHLAVPRPPGGARHTAAANLSRLAVAEVSTTVAVPLSPLRRRIAAWRRSV